MLTADQEARLLIAADAHRDVLDRAIGRTGVPDDLMVSRGKLERAMAATSEPVELLLAWMERLVSDERVRPLDADLEVSWPRRPDPDDVEIAVRLAGNPRCWYYEVRAALLLAEQFMAENPAGAGLVEGLTELRARIEDDRMHSSEFFRSKLLPWIRGLIAETTPPDLVDFSFIDVRDAWGPTVIRLAERAGNPAAVARGLLHLRSPRGSRASKTWWVRTSDELTADPVLADVITASLRSMTKVRLTARSDRDGWDVPDEYLLAPANELLGRGMAWAAQLLEPTHALMTLLGEVALRSATMVWVTPAHRMISPKVAYASIDSLIAVRTDDANTQLQHLVDEIRFPILVRRIGEHLGEPQEKIDRRIAELKKRGPLPRPDRD